jgi:hypothetical protein
MNDIRLGCKLEILDSFEAAYSLWRSEDAWIPQTACELELDGNCQFRRSFCDENSPLYLEPCASLCRSRHCADNVAGEATNYTKHAALLCER